MKNVETFYPLSPLQKGLLFHAILAPESALYFQQMNCTIDGDLDVAAWQRAWQQAVDRHSTLRTSFLWEGLKEPVQVVHQQVELPVTEEDWREHAADEQQRRLEEFLLADRLRGFDVTRAPLMRLALLRRASDSYHFVWSHHHLLLDGWSVQLLLKDVFGLYEAERRGVRPTLDAPRPYRDYIAWLKRQDLEKAERYWRETLRGFSAPTPFGLAPRARAGDAAKGEDQGEERWELTVEETGRLQGFARRGQVTLNTLAQGAWGLLLSRYAGAGEAVFGATVSGRPAEMGGVEGMLGLFINTLPVRVRVGEGEEVCGWLRGVQEQQVEARQYEYSPLSEVQRWSEVERGQSLFDTLLIFQNFPTNNVAEESDNGLVMGDVQSYERTNYPFSLVVSAGDALEMDVTYDPRRFDRETVRRVLGHFGHLLNEIASGAGRLLSELDILTPPEREQVLVEWNDTGHEYARDLRLHELFEQQVERTPDAVAVISGEARISYRELNRRANQAAHHLRDLGVAPEARVGVCVERSIEMIVALLAVLKSGAAYVPLDPGYPLDRLSFILEDSQASVLLTQQHLLQELPLGASPDRSVTALCLDADDEILDRQPDTNLNNLATASNLAYLIYTSGSTGTPKGVMVQHGSLTCYTETATRMYEIDGGDTVLQFSSINFDASVEEIYPCLTQGGTLVLRDDEMLISAAEFLRRCGEQGVTLLSLPTAYWHVLTAVMSAAEWEQAAVLRLITFGGESVLPERVREFVETMGGRVRLMNSYGPTEATVVATMGEIGGRSGGRGIEEVGIGRPVANTQAYVLDSRLRPVPVGVAGELCIGGEGLARGYLNRPDLTAERFIPDPFGGQPGARLYRTGDRVSYLADGNLQYMGRLDHQVKIRGYRIETGEVETVLGGHEGVREAVVIAREDTPGDKRLVAYVVVAAGSSPPGVSELRTHLREKLPEYMMPAHFLFLDELPLTPNGKVDRKGLPAPEAARPELTQSYAAPRNAVEETLAGIWSGVLGIKDVGIHDNFFELGGDSILSLQITARSNQAKVRITLKQLFDNPTIARLATVVGAAAAAIEVEQGAVTGDVPLTPIQRLFFELNLPDPAHYNQATLLEVRKEIDAAAMAQAVKHLLAHHDALRLRFVRDEAGGVRQFNAAAEEHEVFSVIRLSGVEGDGQERAIEAASDELQRSLDLAAGPLIRVGLFDLGAERPGRLLIVIHHLAVDGVSWRILMDDLHTAYEQLSGGQPTQLPPKTTSFKQWAERLREYAQSDAPLAEKEYWTADSRRDVKRLPVDYRDGVNTEASARTVSLSLGEEETRALLQAVPAAYHTQINDVLMTGLVQTLLEWTKGSRVLVEMEGHGREELVENTDLSRTVGWFTSVFPLVLELEQPDDVGRSLKSIKEQLRQTPNRGIGYGLLRHLRGDAELEATLDAFPSPEVCFNYLGQWDQTLAGDSPFAPALESGGATRSEQGLRSYLLDISGDVGGGQLHMNWTYSENIHRRHTVEALARNFMEALRAMISHCQSPEAGGFTPSDFPAANLSQTELDNFISSLG